MVDAILRVAGPGNIHLGHPAAANPRARPTLKRSSRDALERVDEIAPLSVGVSMFLEIKPETVAEVVVTQDKGKLLDDAGSFGVDDGAVSGFRILEVGNVLVDRRCAPGGIYSISGRFDGLVEALPDNFIGLERGKRLVCHVLRETFLEPEIVEPAHRGEVAEPLVSEFVEQQDVAMEMIAVSGRNAKENGFFAQKSGSGVFHSAVSESGDHDHVVFGKREWLREKAGKIIDSLRGDLLHFGRFFQCFFEFRLANTQSGQAGSFMHFAKGAHGEGKKIGADGTSFGKDSGTLAGVARRLGLDSGVGNRSPVFRSSEFQMEAAFQVGLIETGKSHFGVHGNKKRVEVFGVVVFVFESSDGFSGRGDGRGEIEADHILTGMNRVGRQLDVTAFYSYGNSSAIDGEVCGGALTEVEQNGGGRIGAEVEFFVAGGGRRLWGEREA